MINTSSSSGYSHSQAEDLLLGDIGGELLSNHVLITRPWGSESSYVPSKLRAIAAKEFPIFNNSINGHNECHRIDVLLFCGAGKSTTFKNENFTVGIEAKVTVENLFCDQKIPAYFGRTDFFYLAVPDYMLCLGLMKAAQWRHVGVASLDSGKIYKPSLLQFPAAQERIAILERLLLEKSHIEITAPINPNLHGLSTIDGLQKIDWSNGYPEYIKI